MALPLLKVVQLTLTNKCQCNCEHCGVANLREAITGELTGDQVDSLFQDFKLSGCRVVDLFGGEPTLRRDLFDIIARGKSYGFILSLETNGYVVDGAYLERLKAAGLDQIYLSLDDYRAEYHDKRRRRSGSFDRAVRALELGAKTGIIMHVSIVPQTREFFTNGDMNRFMQFVLERGAKQVRLLLPRFVGHSIREEGGPVAAGEETDLFSHVSPRYHNYIYVHTPGTPLNERNLCTAKQVFCHVMSNGWVAPCPYFPLVFGDATREPIVDIFERIQSHPLVRLGGDYCPMRNEEYINTHIRKLGIDRPFFPITVENHIDLGAPCGAHCPDCSYGARSSTRPVEEIIREIKDVAPEYTRIELYGGDALLRDDLFAILDRIPRTMEIAMWTACSQAPKSGAFVQRLRSYRIGAIKLRLTPATFGSGRLDTSNEFGESLRTVSMVSAWGLPVYLYLPMDRVAQNGHALMTGIHDWGVERLYAFSKDLDHALGNSVACFGKGLERVRLLSVQKETHNAPLA